MAEEEDVTCDDVSETDDDVTPEDVPDGIPFLKQRGKYNPRKKEAITNTIQDDFQTQLSTVNNHDVITRLLFATRPDMTWRSALWRVLREARTEIDVKNAVLFLRYSVSVSIKAAISGGAESRVVIEAETAPSCLQCRDWVAIMTGVGLVVTSPDSVRHIGHVDVTTGNETDVEALKGFFCLLESLLGLTWSSLQILTRLDEHEGRLLLETVCQLEEGFGIPEASRDALSLLDTTYPYFLRTLGFRRSADARDTLQWGRPDVESEFSSLCHVLHGMFRETDSFKTTI